MKYEEKEVLPAEKEKPSHDLAGVWQGTMELEDLSYNCSLHLMQKGDNLSGTMIVSYIRHDQLSLVQETMAGEIKGDAVSLYGISYSFMQQGAASGYNLDTFSAQISSEGNEMSGIAKDTAGHSGVLSLKREAFERNTSPRSG